MKVFEHHTNPRSLDCSYWQYITLANDQLDA